MNRKTANYYSCNLVRYFLSLLCGPIESLPFTTPIVVNYPRNYYLVIYSCLTGLSENISVEHASCSRP